MRSKRDVKRLLSANTCESQNVSIEVQTDKTDSILMHARWSGGVWS